MPLPLREVYQQQLRQRVNQVINERWRFDDSEDRLRASDRLILPDQPTGRLRVIEGALTAADRVYKEKL